MVSFKKHLLGLCMASVLTPWAATAADLKVGFVTSLSGPASSLGIPYSKGMQVAAAHLPEMAGKKVTIVQLDDASDPTTASRNARKLIVDDKVDVVIGTAGTPSALAIAGVARELQTPFLCIANCTPRDEQGAWLVTIPHSTPLMMDATLDHMKASGVKRVAYIGFSDAWGDTVYDALMKAAPHAGIQVVANERYARADTSVTGQVLKIVAAKPDAVLTGTSGTPGALPYLALATRNYRGKLYGTVAIISDDFLRVGGQAVEGLTAPSGPLTVVDQLPKSNPVYKVGMEYRDAYQKMFKTVPNDAFGAYSFDSWLVLADSAKRAMTSAEPGTPAFRSALRDALVNAKEVVGTQGIYTYTPASRPFGTDRRGVVMVKVEKGHWKYIGD